MSDAARQQRPRGGGLALGGLPRALEWMIAWRHLRVGDDRGPWVLPLTLAGLYLLAVGLGFAWTAATMGAGAVADGAPLLELEAPAFEPLQRYYGVFAAVTLTLAAIALVFGALSWFFNLLSTIITMSVLLGCMALVVVLSLMSGLESDLRDKILNQRAHILVSAMDGAVFGDYDAVAAAIAAAPGVAGASPYLEGEVMVRSGLNRQGAMLRGVDPVRQLQVSNLGELMREGKYEYLVHPEQIPDPDPFALLGGDGDTPWRLRHLEPAEGATDGAKPTADKATKLPPPAPARADALPTTTATATATATASAEQDEREPPASPAPPRDAGTAAAPADTAASADAEPPAEAEPAATAAVPLPSLPLAEPGGLAGAGGFGIGPFGSALAGDAPALPEPGADGDGWEDPAATIADLRARGELPAPAPAAAEEPDGELMAPNEPAAEPAAETTATRGAHHPLLIGRELAMELGVHVGAPLQLITPVGRMTPAGRVPGVVAGRVGGVFFSGMYEYDRKNVYAPLDVVQRFLRTGDRVSGIEVKLLDVDRIDAGRAAVDAAVAATGRDLRVEDWRDLNRNLFSAMFLEKVAMFIALLFVVLVASFGILASNLMSVLEKSKEIAILKAMGCDDDGILRVFVAEGLCVGLLGSTLGIAAGLLLCWALDSYGLPLNENVYYIERLPVVVNPLEVGVIGVAALAIVWLSSLYPAMLASRTRPVDGLRQAER